MNCNAARGSSVRYGVPGVTAARPRCRASKCRWTAKCPATEASNATETTAPVWRVHPIVDSFRRPLVLNGRSFFSATTRSVLPDEPASTRSDNCSVRAGTVVKTPFYGKPQFSRFASARCLKTVRKSLA